MNKVFIGATALVIAIPAMAQMQPQPPVASTVPMTQRMDPTQTRDQAVARVRDHFAKMDANRDGFVGTDEIQAMRGQQMHKMGKMGGRRGDRMAQRERLGRDPAKAFDRLDANRDGMISRDEFGKAREMRIERRVVINNAPGAPGATMEGEHRGMHRMRGMGGARMGGLMMRMADLDKDGRVSLQEATTSALQRFDRVDANRDGQITPDERRQNRDMRQNRQPMPAPKAG